MNLTVFLPPISHSSFSEFTIERQYSRKVIVVNITVAQPLIFTILIFKDLFELAFNQ